MHNDNILVTGNGFLMVYNREGVLRSKTNAFGSMRLGNRICVSYVADCFIISDLYHNRLLVMNCDAQHIRTISNDPDGAPIQNPGPVLSFCGYLVVVETHELGKKTRIHRLGKLESLGS